MAWTKEMMDAEVVECARYGDTDDLRALLADGADVNSKDDGGSTGMHKAAANGQVESMIILKEFNALHLPNDGGNLPCHWAVQNGQLDAFKFIVDNYDIDVLAKNGQGRSTLTEAFTKGNEDVLEAVLSHPSASEEKLINTSEKGGTVTIPDEDNSEESSTNKNVEKVVSAAVSTTGSHDDGSNNDKTTTVFTNIESNRATEHEASAINYDVTNAVTHFMALSTKFSDKSILLRELPITRADNPFGSETAPEDDTTGLGLWPATVLCARWMAQEHIINLMHDKCVIELGAGCGLPGLCAAYYGTPKSVYITDIHEPTLKNAVHNISINKDIHNVLLSNNGDGADRGHCIISGVNDVPTSVTVRNVSWTDKNSFPSEVADVLIGSDLVYDANILSVLCPAVHAMLKNGGTFLYVAPDNARDGMAVFVDAMQAIGLICTKQEECDISDNSSVYKNPLSRPSKLNYTPSARMGDEAENDIDTGDDFVLHFYDLARKQPHTFYTFVKVETTSDSTRDLSEV